MKGHRMAPKRERSFLRALGRGVRNTALLLVLMAAVIGIKAWQNQRDVVDSEPFASYVALTPLQTVNFRIANPYNVQGEWYKVQLHVHTDRSIDGKWTLDEALAAYAGAGFDFVAVTDHDKVTTTERVPTGLILIPAEENTISFPFWPLGQHAVHLFAEDHVKRGSATTRFDMMRAGGGLISIAHANWHGNLETGLWKTQHLMAVPQFTLMEVFNPHSDPRLDTQLWHEVAVRRGPDNPVWAVAVDDAHDHNHMFNTGWIQVRADEYSLPGLRAALVRGSLYATTGPVVAFGASATVITVTEADDQGSSDQGLSDRGPSSYEVTFIDAAGDIVGRHDGPLPAAYEATGAEGFVRVEVVSLSTGKRAWSQPFWIVAEEGVL